jgi:hypothetical protein
VIYIRWSPLQGPSLVVLYRRGGGVGRRDAVHLMRLSLRLANRRSYTYCVPLVEGSHKCTVITHISSSYRHLTLGVTFLTSTDAYCYLDTQCATYHIAYILFSLVLCFGFLLSLDVTYCRYSLSFVRLQVTLRVNFKARVGIHVYLRVVYLIYSVYNCLCGTR